MTPWLHVSVLVIVVGSSAAVVPPGSLPHGTDQRHGIAWTYDAGARSRASAEPSASPSGVPSHSAPAHGPRYTAASPSPLLSGGSGEPSPGHGPLRASPSASVTPSRAGSRAGEGRQRPGRREEPAAEDTDTFEDDTAATASGDSSDSASGTDSGDGELAAVPQPPRRTAAAPRSAERTAATPKVFILPLGTGLVLIGLGLGLGLFALRTRRG